MSEKRIPATIRPSSSKRLTPRNLNTTVMSGSGARMVRQSSTSKFFANTTRLDLTRSSVAPKIKSKLNDRPTTDYELECDLAYGEYLQTLMMQAIVAKTITKHQHELEDQLAIQKDKIHNSNTKYKALNDEITFLTTLEQVDEVLKQLQDNVNAFEDLANSGELNNILEQLLNTFKASSCNIPVKNVNPVIDQHGTDRLIISLQTLLSICDNVVPCAEDLENVHKLAASVKKYQQVFGSNAAKQLALNEIQKAESCKLLKFLSDKFAAKENY